jgi:hypothetical protein
MTYGLEHNSKEILKICFKELNTLFMEEFNSTMYYSVRSDLIDTEEGLHTHAISR